MPNSKDRAYRRLTIYAGEASLVINVDFMQEVAEILDENLSAFPDAQRGCLSRFSKKLHSAVDTAERLSQKQSEVDRSKSARELNGLKPWPKGNL